MKNSLYKKTLEELFKIRNPQIDIDEKKLEHLHDLIRDQSKNEEIKVKIDDNPLTIKAVFELSTGRNRNLITIEGQNKLRETVVAFFGMSVGAGAVVSWILVSRADTVKIIDPDSISATNLNRLSAGWSDIGKKKVTFVEEKIQAISPYTKVISLDNTTVNDINGIFNNNPVPRYIIDEIDRIEDKVMLRKLAKKNKIPVLSAADVGDNVILDIERYDLDPPSTPIFLNRVADIEKIDFNSLTDSQKKKLIIKLVGFEDNSEALIDSLFGIGNSIPTWPQLGTTATIAGGVVASTLKKIILGENIRSGRYFISLDDILVCDYNKPHVKNSREIKINHIRNLIDKNDE